MSRVKSLSNPELASERSSPSVSEPHFRERIQTSFTEEGYRGGTYGSIQEKRGSCCVAGEHFMTSNSREFFNGSLSMDSVVHVDISDINGEGDVSYVPLSLRKCKRTIIAPYSCLLSFIVSSLCFTFLQPCVTFSMQYFTYKFGQAVTSILLLYWVKIKFCSIWYKKKDTLENIAHPEDLNLTVPSYQSTTAQQTFPFTNNGTMDRLQTITNYPRHTFLEGSSLSAVTRACNSSYSKFNNMEQSSRLPIDVVGDQNNEARNVVPTFLDRSLAASSPHTQISNRLSNFKEPPPLPYTINNKSGEIIPNNDNSFINLINELVRNISSVTKSALPRGTTPNVKRRRKRNKIPNYHPPKKRKRHAKKKQTDSTEGDTTEDEDTPEEGYSTEDGGATEDEDTCGSDYEGM